MKIKFLPGTYGLALIYDAFTRSLIFSPLPGVCWKLEWPRKGVCKFCPHGPSLHSARRDHGMIEWSCSGKMGSADCECEHYEPVRS